MAERRRNCHQCTAYDRETRRCTIGKANPKRKLDAVSLAETLGPRALCLHSPYREPLILRMRWPDRRFRWAEYVPRHPEPPLEIEIIYPEDTAAQVKE